MATITYDGIKRSDAKGLVTFTDVPNILTVVDEYPSTSYAKIVLEFSGSLKTISTKDGQFYITVLGETITSVLNPSDGINKSFYCSYASVSTAFNVAKALRNCATIAANFTVQHTGSSVIIEAMEVGAAWTTNNVVSTNITSQYINYTAYNGDDDEDTLQGALISVDVMQNSKYVTTLTKNFHDYICSFDMSPVLTTLAKQGTTTPYSFAIVSSKNGEFTKLGDVGMNYIIPGYMCNQGKKFIDLSSQSIIVAQNYSRGNTHAKTNNTVLYVYGNSIDLSVFQNTKGWIGIDVHYRNSAGEDIPNTAEDFNLSTSGGNKLEDIHIPLTQSKLNQATYVDIEFEAVPDNIRYNVIKPLKATEYYQRILWRNSYGGISFFDFTGAKSEFRDVETTTYQKNIFGYYTSPRNTLDKIYENDVTYTVTLKSHIFENDGKYLFNDLAQSAEVWTEINGEQYEIIIKSVSVDEMDSNDIYQATVKYVYSMKPSIL